mgnify:FL=1
MYCVSTFCFGETLCNAFLFFCFYETQYIASLLLGVLAIEFVKIFCDGGHGVPCPYFGVSCVVILGMGGRCRA